MKAIRQIGSLAFVVGLFVCIFIGVPWHVVVSDDPVVPVWLRVAVFLLLGGILVVLITLAVETWEDEKEIEKIAAEETDGKMILLNADQVPGRKIQQICGLVQGHTVFAIWLGKDLSAIARLILGGELTEYTEMMGAARTAATNRMISKAMALGADAIINVRYMTTSVIGSAAELLVYGTAVKLDE